MMCPFDFNMRFNFFFFFFFGGGGGGVTDAL